jgi:hypothetical protein
MNQPIDLGQLTPTADMLGEDAAETVLLHEMLERAERYLTSHPWCPPIAAKYLGVGIGGVLALFLFQLETAVDGSDEWLWVVVGDLPSAYFVVDEAPSARSALSVYCDLMQEWADAVCQGGSLGQVFPVEASATVEHAEMLKSRVKYLRESLIPTI